MTYTIIILAAGDDPFEHAEVRFGGIEDEPTEDMCRQAKVAVVDTFNESFGHPPQSITVAVKEDGEADS